MSSLISIRTYSNRRVELTDNPKWGKTSIIESTKDIPFEIKRVFYIYGIQNNIERANHRNHKNRQVIIVLNGSLDIYLNDGKQKSNYHLANPTQGLLIEAHEFRRLYNLAPNTTILVLNSDYYDVNDYIDEDYS